VFFISIHIKYNYHFKGFTMKKLLLVPALLISLLASNSAFAVEGMAVIDMRSAVLQTQVSQATFKALEEESEYAGNVEQAQLLQADRQAIAEKLQKDGETLSQEEVAKMQRDIQTKTKDLEFIVGKIQAKQEETADQLFRELNPSLQKILSELIAAKEVKVLLGRDQILFADTALDLTDDVTSMLDVAAADGADKK
jgi:Skp family chaperone for outer membrane proteins